MKTAGGRGPQKATVKKTAAKGGAAAQKGAGRNVARGVGRFFLTLFLLVVITVSIVGGTLAVYILVFVKPQDIDLSNPELKFTSMIYANDASGTPQLVSQVNGGQDRIWVSIDQVPDNLKNAFISTEDKRFYEHEGVDWQRTAGAFLNFFLHFYSSNQGGSTITQQLIKNINGDTYNRTPGVKIAEIVTARSLETQYSKDQILESYLNTIPLGGSAYGVQAAANVYFGKDVKDLDLAQCAVLAGLTQAPNSYNPLKHPDKAKSRQEYVLSNMLSQKMITNAQYDAAKAEKLTYVGQKPAIRGWFEDQVINDVINDLVSQKGYKKDKATSMVLTGGLKIYSTMDTRVQGILDDVYQNNVNNTNDWAKVTTSDPKQKDAMYQSGMVVMDYTGKVVAVEGRRGAKTTNLGLSFATGSNRSPGSSIKPIGVYGPAIEQGLISWNTVFQDAPPTTVNGKPYPSNDDYWSYQNLTVAEALARSKNTIAVNIGLKLTAKTSLSYLLGRLGISDQHILAKADKNGNSDTGPSLFIGGLTSGPTVEEMAAAYQVFGNGGIYNKPYTYTKVVDNNGNTILENKPTGTRAFSQETATIVNRLLQNNVAQSYGTGHAASLSSTTVGGKTGTTNNNFDRWFVGITPDYVGAVWTGYETPVTMNTSSNPALVAWRAVMSKVQATLDSKTFPAWGDVVQASDGGWYKTGDPNMPK